LFVGLQGSKMRRLPKLIMVFIQYPTRNRKWLMHFYKAVYHLSLFDGT